MVALYSPGTVFTAEIHSLDADGRGQAVVAVGPDDNVDVTIRGGFPGDVVKAVVEKIFPKHRTMLARVIKCVQDGPERVDRVCPHREPCPACPFQGFDPSSALEFKKQRIEFALQKQGLDLPVESVIGQTKLPYRQRVKLMVGGPIAQPVLGVYAPGTHNLVAADQCAYVLPKIKHLAANIADALAGQDAVKAVVLREMTEGVALTLVANRPFEHWQQLKAFIDNGEAAAIYERITTQEGNSIVGGEITRQFGPDFLTPLEGGPKVHPDTFCQTDPWQSERITELVADYLMQDGKDGVFVDGYAGNGAFARALKTKGAAKVVGIETTQLCEKPLQEICDDVWIEGMETAVSKLAGQQLAGIVVDPPRRGLMELAKPLADLKAARLVLVSCNPNAMARDVEVLVANGYAVEKIQPVDLFEGTPEVETVVCFTMGNRPAK